MGVVNGFPFVIPDLNAAFVAIPWFDPVEEAIFYEPITVGYLIDRVNGVTTLGTIMALFALLNKANPDWKQVPPNLPHSFTNIKGTFSFARPNIVKATITITGGQTEPDAWWQSDDFRKFGVCWFTTNATADMPVQWINNIVVNVYNPQGLGDSFQGVIAPGCTATVTIYSIDDETTTSVPPLYYDDETGINISPVHGFVDKFAPPGSDFKQYSSP